MSVASHAAHKGRDRSVLLRAWAWLRQLSGDVAYENYLRHVRQGERPLTRRDFYLDSMRRRYSTVSRCC